MFACDRCGTKSGDGAQGVRGPKTITVQAFTGSESPIVHVDIDLCSQCQDILKGMLVREIHSLKVVKVST